MKAKNIFLTFKKTYMASVINQKKAWLFSNKTLISAAEDIITVSSFYVFIPIGVEKNDELLKYIYIYIITVPMEGFSLLASVSSNPPAVFSSAAATYITMIKSRLSPIVKGVGEPNQRSVRTQSKHWKQQLLV